MTTNHLTSGRRAVKRERGFSLIEVIIAIGILGIVSAAIVTYFTWSFGVFNYTNVNATEQSLARTRMEQIKSDNWSDTFSYGPSPRKSGLYIVSYTGENVTDQPGLQLITVIVSRSYSESPGNQKTGSVTVQGYKGR